MIIGPSPQRFPAIVTPPVVQIRPSWDADWITVPEMTFVRGHRAVAGLEADTAEFAYRFGAVKNPWQNEYRRYGAASLTGWWVRVMMAGDDGNFHQQWTGRLAGDGREIFGPSPVPTGVQSWQAYGPTEILRRIHVGRSFWWSEGKTQEIGWLPSVNDRDHRGWLIGNRSDEEHGGTYLFGGKKTWTAQQFVDYLFRRFVEHDGGPRWSLGGQADLLDDFREVIHGGTTRTVLDYLQELIPINKGVSFQINLRDGDPGGFEVSVFALSSEHYSFCGTSLPRNPNTVEIRVGDTPDCRARVATTSDYQYGRLRVLGRRVVVCCSLGGNRVEVADIAGSLRPQWPAALEDEYRTPPGDLPGPATIDAARKNERFRSVFQDYGPPADWDYQGGAASPALDFEAHLIPADGDETGTKFDPAPRQTQTRRFLSWLPLQEKVDYSVDPPQNNNPATATPDYLAPLVWVADFLADPLNPPTDTTGLHFLPVHKLGISVAISQTEMRLRLQATPNHLLSYGFSDQTYTPGLYDAENMVATVAFETDQRFCVEYWVGEGVTPSDGVLEVEVPHAELWLLAPSTVVGVKDPTGDKGPEWILSGDKPRFLRDDRQRLYQAMAGVLARYRDQRARAEVSIDGYKPWGQLVGQILTVLESAGDVQRIQAPITSISWDAGEKPTTTIRTGFAR
jgi:hypothetical protein